MHLCVSSKFADIYKLACSLVQELFTNIYKEYEVFCHRKGFRNWSTLKIKRIEEANTVQNDRANAENVGDIYNIKREICHEDSSLNESFSRMLSISSLSNKNEENINYRSVSRRVIDPSMILQPKGMNLKNNWANKNSQISSNYEPKQFYL